MKWPDAKTDSRERKKNGRQQAKAQRFLMRFPRLVGGASFFFFPRGFVIYSINRLPTVWLFRGKLSSGAVVGGGYRFGELVLSRIEVIRRGVNKCAFFELSRFDIGKRNNRMAWFDRPTRAKSARTFFFYRILHPTWAVRLTKGLMEIERQTFEIHCLKTL